MSYYDKVTHLPRFSEGVYNAYRTKETKKMNDEYCIADFKNIETTSILEMTGCTYQTLIIQKLLTHAKSHNVFTALSYQYIVDYVLEEKEQFEKDLLSIEKEASHSKVFEVIHPYFNTRNILYKTAQFFVDLNYTGELRKEIKWTYKYRGTKKLALQDEQLAKIRNVHTVGSTLATSLLKSKIVSLLPTFERYCRKFQTPPQIEEMLHALRVLKTKGYLDSYTGGSGKILFMTEQLLEDLLRSKHLQNSEIHTFPTKTTNAGVKQSLPT